MAVGNETVVTGRHAGIEAYPGMVLAQVYRAVRHAMDDALRGLGLTTPQWGALITIAANEGISGADLARIRNITPQTVNTILQNLEHADLICRRHAPGNGTILLLELTAAGRARVDEARERIDPIQSRLFGPLSPMERVQLVDMLTRCCEAFRGEPTQGCPED